MLTSKFFYIAIAAGAAFIAIGTASSIYSNIPVDVPLDNTIRPGTVDIITPDMNVGNTATISINGSTLSPFGVFAKRFNVTTVSNKRITFLFI